MVTKLLIYKILQLSCMMVLGFVLTKCKVIKNSDSAVLSKISLYLLMPSAILNAFDFEMTDTLAKGLVLSFAAAIIIHIVYFGLDFGYKKLVTENSVERASVMYSNAGNLIIPIVSFVLGEEWVVYSSAFLSVQLLFLWSHGIKLFSENEKFSIKKIVLNVNIIAIAVGMIMMLFSLRLPTFVKDITSSFGGMLGTVGMLIAGIIAADIDFKKVMRDKRLYRAVAFRMIIYPAITFGILKLLSLIPVIDSDKILLITYLACITPAAATVMQFAKIKEQDADYAAAINIFTTVAAILTMPLLVSLFNIV